MLIRRKGKKGTGEKVGYCGGKAVACLPNRLDGTHADKNFDSLGHCSSYTSYQRYHNRGDIDGLGIVRGKPQQGKEHALESEDKESLPCGPLSR